MTGKEVQKLVVAYLGTFSRHLHIERLNTGAARLPGKGGKMRVVQFNAVGTADLEGWLKGSGRKLAIECKATGELPTDEQFQRILDINNDGGVAMWADRLEWVQDVMPDVVNGHSLFYRGHFRGLMVAEPGELIEDFLIRCPKRAAKKRRVS